MKESLLTVICEVQYGYAFDSKLFNDSEGLPVIRIRDVVRGYSETKTTEKCPDSYIINNGDILIGMDGEFNIARWKGGKALLNQRVCKLIPKYVNADYVLYYMPIALKAIEEKTPFVTVKHLSAKEINKICVPLPDEYQQQYISKSLALCDSLIFQNKLLLNKLDELIKSRFVEMFGDPILNPKGWEMTTIGEIVTEVKYGTSRPAIDGGKYAYLRMNNLTYDGYLDLADLKRIDIPDSEIDKCIVRKGDVLFNRTNSIELVGKTCVFDKDEDMIIAGYIIRVRLKPVMLPLIMSYFMNTDALKKKLRSMAKGAVNQANINAQELKAIKIYLPPTDLQQQFADFVAQTDKSKLVVKKQIEKLETLKKSLMQEYFG